MLRKSRVNFDNAAEKDTAYLSKLNPDSDFQRPGIALKYSQNMLFVDPKSIIKSVLFAGLDTVKIDYMLETAKEGWIRDPDLDPDSNRDF